MPEIVLLPGDGIGPEVVAEAKRVLECVAEVFGRTFSFREHAIGGHAVDVYGDPLPETTAVAVRSCDAVLLGAVGGPKWDREPADRRPEKGLLRLRKEMAVFANLRPVRSYESLLDVSTIRPEVLRGVDFVFVRELTGGIYFGRRQRVKTATGERVIDELMYTAEEIERIVRTAFAMAHQLGKPLTSVDKANVLESSRLWREVVERVAADYPGVTYEHMLVDNCAMQLIRNPRQFGVVVTENMFGDILSDEAAMLTGSIGMLPSASLGQGAALYEPIHGSAPDIAGQGKANPLGTILSAAMMLRFSFQWEREARAVEEAVDRVLSRGLRTPDIAQPGTTVVTTSEMGRAVCEEMARAEMEKVRYNGHDHDGQARA